MSQSQREYISQVKIANKQLWDALNKLQNLQKQWNALAYGDNLIDDESGLTAAEIGAVVFDTTNAFVAVQNNGHATNMAKLL